MTFVFYAPFLDNICVILSKATVFSMIQQAAPHGIPREMPEATKTIFESENIRLRIINT